MRQREQFSYRMMGEKLDLDASYLPRSPEEAAPPLPCDSDGQGIARLSGRAAEYFDILVASADEGHEKESELVEQAVALV